MTLKKSAVDKGVVKQAVKRKNKRRKTGKYIGKRTLEWAEVDPNKPEEELWCFGTVAQKKNSHWIVVYDDDVSSHLKWYEQRQMVESEVKHAIAAYKNPKSVSDPSLICAQICVYICQTCVYICQTCV